MAYLKRIDADQITFRKVGNSCDSHLNIMVEEITNFNQNGYATVTQALLDDKTASDGDVDAYTLTMLLNSYNYGMNDRSGFFEETCPNCGAQAGEYEVTTMGGTPDRNKRTCLRCKCTWFGYEVTAEMVTNYIKNKAYEEMWEEDE